MKTINVDRIDQELDRFIAEREWDQFHSIKNLTMALNVEAAELLEIFQWLKEDDSNRVSIDDKLKAKVGEEIADIFIYLLRIAKKSEINIEDIVLEKIKKNSEKYPVSKSKGTAKKYTEL